MRFLERTKVYSFGEFRIENNNDIMKADRQIGIWSRTNKKLYRAIVLAIAVGIYIGKSTLVDGNFEAYHLLMEFSRCSFTLIMILNIVWNALTEKEAAVRLSIESIFDGASMYSILMFIARLVCCYSRV